MNKKKNCNSKYCKYLAAWIQCVNSIALIINSSVTHLWACFSRTNRNQTGPILTATVRFCFRNCPIFFFIAHANMQTVTMDFIEVIWNYSLVFRANSTKYSWIAIFSRRSRFEQNFWLVQRVFLLFIVSMASIYHGTTHWTLIQINFGINAYKPIRFSRNFDLRK